MEMRTGRWGAGSESVERFAAGTGVIFAVLAAVGFLVLGQPDADATDEQISQFFVDNESAMEWQALLFGIAAVFFLWFAGTIGAAVRRAEGDPAGRIPAIIVVTAAAAAGIYLAGDAAWITLAQVEGLGGRVIYELGANAFALSGFIAAGFVLAVATGVMRTGLQASWVAWLGALVALALLISSVVEVFAETDSSFAQVYGGITFFAFLAWVAVVSLMHWWALSPATRAAATTP